MSELISIILAAFGILQIILFFKLWGMTNDVKEMKNMMRSYSNKMKTPIENTERKNGILEKDALVVDLKTEKQMKISELLANGKYKCYSNSMHVGDFAPSEIMEFDEWVSKRI